MIKTNYKVQGMTCTACAKLVSLRIKKIIGVMAVEVDHLCGKMTISSSRNLKVEEISAALASTDFSLSN